MDSNVEGFWTRPAEQGFLRRAADWVAEVNTTGSWLLTDFLTPRELYLAGNTVSRAGLVAATGGGNPFSERRRMLIMPDEWFPAAEDFHITVLALNVKGQPTSHGSILGSVLGTGIDRRKVGDLLVTPHLSAIAVCEDLVPYLEMNWRQVGKLPLEISIATGAIPWHEPLYEHLVVSVASLRTDCVLAQACKWPRSRAKTMIEKGCVNLNFTTLEHADEILQKEDVLSVRGFGRVKIFDAVGVSKKGKTKLELGILKSDEPR